MKTENEKTIFVNFIFFIVHMNQDNVHCVRCEGSNHCYDCIDVVLSTSCFDSSDCVSSHALHNCAFVFGSAFCKNCYFCMYQEDKEGYFHDQPINVEVEHVAPLVSVV